MLSKFQGKRVRGKKIYITDQIIKLKETEIKQQITNNQKNKNVKLSQACHCSN